MPAVSIEKLMAHIFDNFLFFLRNFRFVFHVSAQTFSFHKSDKTVKNEGQRDWIWPFFMEHRHTQKNRAINRNFKGWHIQSGHSIDK